MRIDELTKTTLPLVSFEFFPPKNEEGFAQLYRTIDRLHPLHPSYVSVTYGAGGSERQKTVELAGRIQNEIGIRTLAHLTCAGHTKSEIGEILDQLWSAGIRNVLALRGDPPGGGAFKPTEGGFGYTSELIEFVRARHDFCVVTAGYPEGHPQCLNLTRDLEHLKRKVEHGASVIVTQLFFDNEAFYRWRDQARALGIEAPIVAGIMPIGNVAQIKRFVTMCGAKIPHPLLLRIEAVEEDADAVYQTGVEYATQQCRDLIERGEVDGIHFYTLNRSRATVDICRALRDKLPL
ncbi:MAG: methylenetetrahydrofolate reductase [NAD(P)H] [Cytophagales bacterium]|nr:methylenetetrahydrofolate reductase [NAD(P)H] [Armatimonadota bacterium]